jgi:poly(3-hydroxybutyrate) depolymerase
MYLKVALHKGWRLLAALMGLVLAAVLASCSYPITGKSGTSYDDILTSSITNGTSETGTYANREMIVHMPASGVKPTRAVVFFHGVLSSASGMETVSKMDVQADKGGYMVVYAGSAVADNSWNAGAFSGQAQNVNDEGYGVSLIKELRDLNIGVWGLGFSNGAMLVYRIACDNPDVLPVVGSMSGTLEISSCAGASKFKSLEIHGSTDSTVPMSGAPHTFGGGLIYPVSVLLAKTGSSVTLEQVVPNDLSNPSNHAWAEPGNNVGNVSASATFNSWFATHLVVP